MQNNFHDLTDRNEIANTVYFYNSTESLQSQQQYGYHDFHGKTVDEAIILWEATARKTDDIEKTLYLYAGNADLLASDNDSALVQCLLTHPERHRLRMIGDGSYRTHRIWSHVNCDDKIQLSPYICWMNSEFKHMSNKLVNMTPNEQVDFLFKNFEIVYVQCPIHDSRESLLRWINWEKFDREMDFVGYDDL